MSHVSVQDRARGGGWQRVSGGGSAGGAVYGLGLIGAVVYYVQQADAFWPGVLGVLKALVWPAFLVYDALKALAA
jgi:hypothetical protein